MIQGFKAFIMRGNVVDLAVAVVIGAAFKAVVDALVADIITPIIAAIGGKPDFSSLNFTINKSTFKYGDLINQIISFLIVAAAIYFLIVAPLNMLAERRQRRLAAGEPDPEPKAEDVQLLEQIRDLLASQTGGTPGVTAPSPSPRPGV
ncbi:MAG: large conductance mechanosensitive channel protein MscL [Jatrophihabitans sp.]|uniref:large conductance mechanosensitive channel protein MscL n=1 Tax=Jatrophihabitans sp. TaxID=1932789 RepID=UPI003F7E8450